FTIFNQTERNVQAQPLAFLSSGIFAASGSSERKSDRLKFRNKSYTITLCVIKKILLKNFETV
ncbi:hypothetical protein ACU8DI_15300, partial [Psychroserpens sp. BH13MA-6]